MINGQQSRLYVAHDTLCDSYMIVCLCVVLLITSFAWESPLSRDHSRIVTVKGPNFDKKKSSIFELLLRTSILFMLFQTYLSKNTASTTIYPIIVLLGERRDPARRLISALVTSTPSSTNFLQCVNIFRRIVHGATQYNFFYETFASPQDL